MIVTCEEMKRAEEAAFDRGVSAEGLMEEAGLGLAEIVRQFHPEPGTCVVFCGKGHNGGDALVVARHLAGWGWRIDLRLVFSETDPAPLTAKKLSELRPVDVPQPGPGRVILDGLLGIGARGEPRGAVAEAVGEIQQLRQGGAWVLAIDVPSGLDSESGRPAATCVQADLTATIGAVKSCLLADSATAVVGRLALVPLADLEIPSGSARVAFASELRSCLPPRSFDTHKGQCGRIGLVAGSRGFTGAARLCSAAAVHAGGGLVTLFAREDLADVLAASCAPEVMVQPVRRYREVLDANLDVLAIGPGLGLDQSGDIVALVRDAPVPMVVDADALNAVAHDISILAHCKGLRLLTPHPGEMERLMPREDRDRRAWAEALTATYPVTLLLKGSRTVLAESGKPLWFNSTGNPGMASGGMGDVLTGVCAALLAANPERPVIETAVLGAWLCGRAAECVVFRPGGSPESLSASMVIEQLGRAVTDLRAGVC